MKQVEASKAKDWDKEEFEFNIRYLLDRGRDDEALEASQKRLGNANGAAYIEKCKTASNVGVTVPLMPPGSSMIPSDEFIPDGDRLVPGVKGDLVPPDSPVAADAAARDAVARDEVGEDVLEGKSVEEVLDWVGDDPDRARIAYDAEQASGKPRKGVTEGLEGNFVFE